MDSTYENYTACGFSGHYYSREGAAEEIFQAPNGNFIHTCIICGESYEDTDN